MSLIVAFDEPEATVQALTGGKGVNLGRLTQAGFPVPGGFTVTTSAYAEFLAHDDVAKRLAPPVDALVYEPAELEAQTKAIREIVLNAPIPASLADAIATAYDDLGDAVLVAVRSSGTAEDLADASFAGQHDTYLDVQGADGVVDAVRRCWSSLWTARAVNYRKHNGFEHDQVQIAVVIQRMVKSDVSGVMFTGNPLTTATDETVINATWGLGESLVQGIVTPDTFVVDTPHGTVLEATLGEKELQIVRDPEQGYDVVTEDVGPVERARFSLDTQQVVDLTRLGAKVQDYYGGFPQDIEWGMEDGELFLLQSRPITGVEFSWDADVDLANKQTAPADAVWTRRYADAITTGVVCPLTYSARYPQFSWRHHARMWEVLGIRELEDIRNYKYWKGEVYFSAEGERLFVERLVPPPLRPMFLDFIPAAQHEQTLEAPFDEGEFLRAVMRWHVLDPETTPGGFLKTFEAWRRRDDYFGLSYGELRDLEDEALIDYCRHMMDLEGQWGEPIFLPFFVTFRLAMAGLAWMVGTWYDGGPADATFAKLVAGSTRPTDTLRENRDLSALVKELRDQPVLRSALEEHESDAFFAELENSREGRAFLARYAAFIDKWGHRGHSDRDFIYPRRAEDPSIDYRAFKLMLNVDETHDAEANERRLTQERNATLDAVIANVLTKPRGAAKAEILKTLVPLVHEYAIFRDDERNRPTDIIMFACKRGFVEMGRRLHERGQLEEARDVHFLSETELYQYFRGRIDKVDLLKAKIEARRRDCDRMLRKEVDQPMTLQRNRPVEFENPIDMGADGVYPGKSTSPGVMTGTARVVGGHDEMGRVGRGEILVTHSTDPGWNPVFNLISAVVIETGGMLSHASCLAREYGFPAVHLPGATKLIEDGATITVDGNAGIVTVQDTEQAPTPELASATG